MKILWARHIDGPNVYIYKPILVARIDLGRFTERESCEFQGFSDRLLRLLPGLREHHCAKGAPGGFVERLYGGTYFGHIVEHVAIELACCLGLDVHYGKTLYAGGMGQYDIVMECKAFECQRLLLDEAIQLVQAMVDGQTWNLEQTLARAQRLLRETGLGPSTQAIVDAAVRRGIPVRRIGTGSLIQLGYGCARKLVEATVTEQTSAVAVDIACDKQMTKQLLRDAALPVPAGGTASSLEEALKLFERLGAPVVVKPQNGNQGRGVSLNLNTPEELRDAFDIAREYADHVIVEQYVEGRNFRLLVVGGRFVAASERIPARVVGDGTQTVRSLVEQANRDPRRGDDHELPLSKIVLDSVARNHLRRQGRTLDDVPAVGESVWLRDSANLSTGGEAVDMTDDLHASYRRLAERVAKVIGLDVCGIDLIIGDPQVPSDETTCFVIEVNACPGIRMHEHPSYGTARRAGEAIVSSLFPTGQGRIPIISITGTNGKTTTTRLIGHGIGQSGKTVGMTTTGGIFIGGECVSTGDTTGPDSARVVLSDPSVEVAVLETARGGIVRGGLAYDKANVAVMTNIAMDHIGQDGVDTIEDLMHIKSLVAECVADDGTVVLNADDERLVALSKRLNANIVFCSMTDDNPVLMRHLARGGVGYYVSRGWLVEARGHLTWEISPISEIPLTLGGIAQFQVENCLAAVAAMRAYGLTRQQIAHALATFSPLADNPGRCVLYRMPGGGHVMLDYGHNPDGFVKIGRWLKRVPHRRLIGVVGVPGDRADAVIRQSASCLAEVFDAFVVKEDVDKRGRREGEVAAILASQIAKKCPEKPCAIVLSEGEALARAIQDMGQDDIVAVFYEKLSVVQQTVEGLGGQPVADFQPLAAGHPMAISL
ncbi:cyanophycin synthetase [Alicyclobacillus cycloheptanicus]|uniref:Cyanophycin synthetase n=1 Tax=Alicyclobacillus cycloheptanicus TaxID=1457 RepID=A0ABT9XIM6_9BACL|nr:cyanophycin synthetase [Alicyclobacillus cycloheptanicus]MDQ0190167.1 cyanophycin synthetase [Alicyclobacillus cycloheptanicus]WDM02579.1 cyanophycin synthetase [Alicyclobacillus cycloheptanicus]